MGRDETELGTRVLHADGDGALVACDPRHARLLDTTFNVLDLGKHRSLHKDTQGGTDQLSTSEQDVLFTLDLLGVVIQSLLDSSFPSLLPSWVAVHDLLST